MPLSRELGLRLLQCGLGRGLLPYQAASSSIQPFGHIRHGPKLGGVGVPFYLGVAGSTSNTMSRKPGLPPCQVASWFMQPFGHNRRGPKIGWGSAPFWVGVWVPSNTVAWAKAYLHTKWHLDASSRLATIKMGRKLVDSASLLGRGAGSPSSTMWPRPRPTSMLSTILILSLIHI